MATSSTDSIESQITWREMVPVVCASTIGTAIEWYDFFLYGFLAVTIFSRLFFPTLDPIAGTIAALTTNLVGFVARPFGGAFFGWFGDRVGRKSTLVSTLLLMGLATMLMGALPGYASIGIAAPVLLAVLRFLQGVGIGGEWGGSILLSMEYGDDRHRGFWASWPQTGVPLGVIFGALAVLLFQQLYPGDAFLSVGWRMPFFLSSILVIVGLYIRLRILETPVFSRLKEQQDLSKAPLFEVLRYNWREIVLSALIRSAETGPFYIFTTFVLTYGVEVGKLNLTLLYTSIACSSAVAFIMIPTFSFLSDYVGRKLWYSIGTVLMAAFAFPYFFLMETQNSALVIVGGILSLGICFAWLYGPEAALIAERFRARVRYSGSSLGYQLASITAGGPTPIIATYLLENHNQFGSTIISGAPSSMLIALYMIAMSLISLVAVQFLKEYTGKPAA
ncbi:MAG TPA: MFS transporter [Ktedonobacteraceae bacterium]|jgi:MFS family permease|nr:MFS transporter [Ktedonobacteraceae bacterium]